MKDVPFLRVSIFCGLSPQIGDVILLLGFKSVSLLVSHFKKADILGKHEPFEM